MATMPLGGAQFGYQGAPLDWKRSFFSVMVIMGERSELFWLRAIASLAEVIEARLLVIVIALVIGTLLTLGRLSITPDA